MPSSNNSGYTSVSLAKYKGKTVKVICEQCDLLETFDRDVLFAECGDFNMPGLLEPPGQSIADLK